ncbi:hypothetical protein L9F63_017898, partial [Diploptera punctata]
MEKLDYLKDLGIDGVWLSPIYPSPLADFTYDISNFRDIDPLFGSLEIFDDFVARAKELGIRVIMDYVPGYTSDQHEWFTKSVQKIDPYTDYYTWDDGKLDDDGNRLPPNGWQSIFGGAAWTFSEERKQWFFHQFTPKQPDLNWGNSELVEDMKLNDVMRFWLDKGIDGFRVDAVPVLFEGPLDNNDTLAPQNLPETYNAVKIMRTVADEKTEEYGETKVLMLEAYASVDQEMAYYGTSESPGGHFPFNFLFISDLNGTSTATDFSNVLNNYLEHISQADNRIPNWVSGSIDCSKININVAMIRGEGMHFLSLLLPGVAVTYNGEEIGMEDTMISWKECLDPQGLNAGPDNYLQYTRDIERTPIQWDDTKNAGFSDGNTTWLPVNSNYDELNVEIQNSAEKSHIKVYKNLIQLRKEATFKDGATEIAAITDNVLAFTRTLENHDTYVIVVNVGDETENINLKDTFSYLPDELTIAAVSVFSEHDIGMVHDTTSFEIQPNEAFNIVAVSLTPTSRLTESQLYP